MSTSTATRIPLSVSGGHGTAYHHWPVTHGVPFANGVLRRGGPVRLADEEGTAIPVQSRCLTTWNRDLEYVRWLLLDYQVDLEAGGKGQAFLEYGGDVSPAAPDEPVRIARENGQVVVDTGPMKLLIRDVFRPWELPRHPNALLRCSVRGERGWFDVFCGPPGPFLYMADQHGSLYDSCTAGPPPQVTVEEAGPLRACICIKGCHATESGVRFCPYVLRIHVFAGRSDLRLCHTFVFDQDPHSVELSAVGVRFPLQLGEGLRAAVGGGTASHWAGNWRDVAFLQEDDETYHVWRDGRQVAAGCRTSGWSSLCGSSGSAVAVIKDCWQEYPKGFRVSEEGIDVQIWPGGPSGDLTFTTPFEEPAVFFGGTRDEEEFVRLLKEQPTAPLNLKSLNVQSSDDLLWVEEMLEKHGPDRAASHNDTGWSNGMGAAKTTEIWLHMDGSAVSDEWAEGYARSVQEPLIAGPSPQYTCATGAVGHFYHAGDPRFAEVDRGLDDLFESVARKPVERCRLYGMMRFGNAVCSHAAGPSVSYVHYKDTDPGKALRYVGPYNNEANDQILGLWGNFLRTGRRDHLLWARRYSRCVADVAIIHAHANPSAVGLMHYHNAHQWSGGPSPSHTLIGGILTDYYFSGERRLLDVAEEVAGWAVRTQEPAGIISCRHGRLHREFTGPLWCVMEAYQATWKRQYGDLAERSLNWFLRTLPNPGQYPVSVYTRGGLGDEAHVEPPAAPYGHAREVYPIFAAALRLFDSKKLREHILAEADYFVWEYLTDNFVTADMARELLTPRSRLWEVNDHFYWTDWGVSGNSAAQVVCLAYELTGDLTYAAYCRDHLHGHFARLARRCRSYADWRFTWLCFGSYIPRLMHTVAAALDRDPEGLDQAQEAWMRARQERGRPVYIGPGVDLAKDRMDPGASILNRPPAELPRQAPERSYEPLESLGRLSTDPHPAP